MASQATTSRMGGAAGYETNYSSLTRPSLVSEGVASETI